MEIFHMWDVIPLLGIEMPPSGRSSYNVQCPCCDDSPRKKHLNINLKKDVYIEIGEGNLKEAYRVTGYDIHSTSGVEYVTLDPMYIKDKTPAPERKPEDKSEDYYWLNGGED